MDTPEKNLAEIAWNSINPHCQGIDDHLTPQGIRNWSSAMTAVKAAVLAELPEFVLVHPSEAMPGDEWMKFSGCEWTKVRGGELFADFIPVRRRLHSSSPTEETPVGTPEELHPPVEATPHQGTDAPRAEWKPKYAVGDPVIWVTGDERTPATVVHVLPDQSCEIRLESSTSVRVKEHCLEPAPWKLPEPPEGHQWHRTDWTQDMLPKGWRPYFDGEETHPGSEFGGIPNDSLPLWAAVTGEGTPVTKAAFHFYRTPRALPTPPVPQPEDATAYWRGEYAQLQQRMTEVCVQRDSATSLADELKVKLAAAEQRAKETRKEFGRIQGTNAKQVVDRFLALMRKLNEKDLPAGFESWESFLKYIDGIKARAIAAEAELAAARTLVPVWVPVSERMPTEKDADQDGRVLWGKSDGSSASDDWAKDKVQCILFDWVRWTTIPPLPPLSVETGKEGEPRKSFEEWAVEGPGLNIDKDRDGDYVDDTTEDAFSAWQAALNSINKSQSK
jgi:hypothetical protein